MFRREVFSSSTCLYYYYHFYYNLHRCLDCDTALLYKPLYQYTTTTKQQHTQCLLSTLRNSLLALVLLPRALFLRCPSKFSHGPLTTWWPSASSGFLSYYDGYQSRQPPKPYSMRLRTGTCITPPAWISRFGSILHYASFSSQLHYFRTPFLRGAFTWCGGFVSTTPCTKYLSFYLSDCAGAWVLILSTLSATETTLRWLRFHFA